jgi:hypothetical protein
VKPLRDLAHRHPIGKPMQNHSLSVGKHLRKRTEDFLRGRADSVVLD